MTNIKIERKIKRADWISASYPTALLFFARFHKGKASPRECSSLLRILEERGILLIRSVKSNIALLLERVTEVKGVKLWL